jgi:hypothetical protein
MHHIVLTTTKNNYSCMMQQGILLLVVMKLSQLRINPRLVFMLTLWMASNTSNFAKIGKVDRWWHIWQLETNVILNSLVVYGGLNEKEINIKLIYFGFNDLVIFTNVHNGVTTHIYKLSTMLHIILTWLCKIFPSNP